MARPFRAAARRTHLRMQAMERLQPAIERALAILVKAGADHARRLVSTPWPPPSMPEMPPHLRTGALRSSLVGMVERGGVGAGELRGWIGTPLDYGRFLEMGTIRMAPRPYLRPTLSWIRLSFAPALGRALKG